MAKNIYDYMREDKQLAARIADYLKDGIRKGRVKDRQDVLEELDRQFGTNAGKGVLNNLETNSINQIYKELLKNKKFKNSLPDKDFTIKTDKKGRKRKYFKFLKPSGLGGLKAAKARQLRQDAKEAKLAQKRLKELPKARRPRIEYTARLDTAIKARKGVSPKKASTDLSMLFGITLTAEAFRARRARLLGKKKPR